MQHVLPAGGPNPPSCLRGALVRFKAEGRYQLARIDATLLRPSGQLALQLSGYPRPVAPATLSNANPLADDAAWQQQGQQELAALRGALAGRLPTCGEVRGQAGVRWPAVTECCGVLRCVLLLCCAARCGTVSYVALIRRRQLQMQAAQLFLHLASARAGGGRVLPPDHSAAVGATARLPGSGPAARPSRCGSPARGPSSYRNTAAAHSAS